MKEVYIGTFFGKELIVKTEEGDNFDYAGKFSEHMKNMQEYAIQRHKDEQFLKALESRANPSQQ